MFAKCLQVGVGRFLSIPLFILSLLSYLIPRRGVPLSTNSRTAPLGYIDPLRGFFSIQILLQHANNEYWWWQPPMLLEFPWTFMMFRGGKLALKGFFWMSGYVVTMKLVKLANQKQWEAFLDAASSVLFRRYLRLFLPLLPVTLITLILVKLKVTTLPDNHDLGMDLNKEYLLVGWLKDSLHFMNPFLNIVGVYSGKIGSFIIKPTWSLCAEFRSSVTVMAFLVATCKIPSYKRRVLILCLTIPFMYWQSTFTTMAFLGLFCSELRQSRATSTTLPVSAPAKILENSIKEAEVKIYTPDDLQSLKTDVSPSTQRRRLPALSTLIWLVMFLYSFVLLMDSRLAKGSQFPFNYILPLLPADVRPWWIEQVEATAGAAMFLLPMDQLPFLQTPLRRSFGQYLGELSFGIYACHMPVIHTIWDAGYIKWQQSIYGERVVDNFWIMAIGNIGLAIAVLWAAEGFRKMDGQIARFVAWTKTAMWESKR